MLKYLLRKEFRQIKRNPILPRLLFAFPLIVLLVFPWAASYEIKNLNLSVVDNDRSSLSQQFIQKIVSSGYFRITDNSDSYNEALKSIEKNTSDVIVEIPSNFEKSMLTGYGSKVFFAANAVNGMKGSIAVTYLSGIVGDFNKELALRTGIQSNPTISTIDITQQHRFNPHLNYQVFMVPALMVMILSLICGFLPAFSIVMEKELGTIEQMNVSPVNKVTFILSKLIPFWIMGVIIISIGFLVAWLVYGLVPAGHFYSIYAFAFIFIIAVSGLGLIISNLANTLQQAMFIIFFFMLIFIMLSGLYTPIDSMPQWAKGIAAINPLKYFMEVMRAIYLKGSSIIELWDKLVILIAFAIGLNTIAVITYRKSK